VVSGASASNSGSPFQVAFSSSIPQRTDVEFTVAISADGPYSNTGTFTETVSSLIWTSLYCWNMDTDPGWTVVGGTGNYKFAYGTPTGSGGQYGEADPTAGHTGTKVYGYNLQGDYQNNMSEQTLTTTSFDCSQLTGTTLDFWCWLGVEQSNYDHARIRVSNNGTTWTEVWANSGTLEAGAWEEWSIDISAVADGNSQVYARWVMGTTDSAWTYCGWNIDDVCIKGWIAPVVPTPTPTITPSTPTPTPVPAEGILNGQVILERPGVPPPDASWSIPLSVTLCSGGSEFEIYGAMTDQSGYFSVSIVSGTYDILVKNIHSLANRVQSITIPSGGSTGMIDFGTLQEGDVNNDNSVISSDFFILKATYNLSLGDPGYDERADFNEDDMVTSTDFFMLRSHYNQSGVDCGS
jgi:hypothetical protein